MRTNEPTAIALDKELKRLMDGIVKTFNPVRRAWRTDITRSEVIEFFLLKGIKAFLEEEEVQGEAIKKEAMPNVR